MFKGSIWWFKKVWYYTPSHPLIQLTTPPPGLPSVSPPTPHFHPCCIHRTVDIQQKLELTTETVISLMAVYLFVCVCMCCHPVVEILSNISKIIKLVFFAAVFACVFVAAEVAFLKPDADRKIICYVCKLRTIKKDNPCLLLYSINSVVILYLFCEERQMFKRKRFF